MEKPTRSSKSRKSKSGNAVSRHDGARINRYIFAGITGEAIVRLFLAMLAYVTTLAVVAGATFIVVVMLAGPHAGLLPHWFEVLVMLLGWLAVLLVPFLLARRVWRRFGLKPTRRLR